MGNLKIGERIKKIRTDRGITKYNFAKSIGISDSSLANYENELRVPSSDIIYKICDIYDVSADYLIRGIEDVNKNTSEVLGLNQGSIEKLKNLNNLDNKNFTRNACLYTLNFILNNSETTGITLLLNISNYITTDFKEIAKMLSEEGFYKERLKGIEQTAIAEIYKTNIQNNIISNLNDMREIYNKLFND